MSIIATSASGPRLLSAPPRRGLIAATGAFAVTALFDLIARPPLGDHTYHLASAYVMTALLIPFALGMLWALVELRTSVRPDSHLATTGLRIAAVGLLLFIPCAISSLATANPQALGPVYMVAMLLSLIGTGLLSLALARVGTLPRWAAVAFPLAWLLGGPAGEGGDPIGRGAALILAAICLAIAATVPVRARA